MRKKNSNNWIIKRNEVFLLFFIFCSIAIAAQTKELKIKVYDSSHLPIEEVVCFNVSTTEEVKTNPQGEVVIRGTNGSSFFLFKENYIGKQYSWEELNESPSLILEQDNQTLSELFIYVSPAKNDAGRITYKINKQLLGENPTVFQVIENIPLFFIKGEKVNYKGKEVTLIVNGKKTIGKIENIDPKNIESIEIIPYGHSAYGNTGEPVLNIILKKNVLDYFREDLSLGYNLTKESYVLNANSFFKKNNITISLPIRLGKSIFESNSTTYSAGSELNSSKEQTISDGITIQPDLHVQLNEKNSIGATLFLYTPRNKNTSAYTIQPVETVNTYRQDIAYLNTGSFLFFNHIFNDSTSLNTSFLYTYNEYSNKGYYADKQWNNILYDNALNFDLILSKSNRTLLNLPLRYDVYYSYYQSTMKNKMQDNVTNQRHKFSFTSTLTLTNNLSLATDLSYNFINKNDQVLLNSTTLAFTKKSYSIYLNYFNSYQLISVYDVNKQNSIDDNLNTTIDNYGIKRSNTDHFSLEFNYTIKSGIELFARGKFQTHHNAPIHYLVKSDTDERFKTNVNAGKIQRYIIEVGGFFELADHFIIQSLFTLNRNQFNLVDYTTHQYLLGYDFYAKYQFNKGFSLKLSSSYTNFDLYTPFESTEIKHPFVSFTVEKEFSKKNIKVALVVNNPFIKAKEDSTTLYSNSFDNVHIVDTRFKSKEIKNYASIAIHLSNTLGNNKLRAKKDAQIQATY
ncbi:outer membrane beta-barrel protein [Myroides sp. WP-1]|uniref:outer membrane beta-barrel protein n=1 Tax=Myroides sp. WP-1 TaxID=2759944 RepID=UPI0015FCBE40|nr:outer membrane beta-barrel protein [Myroides sp. WP-1]MBB1140017.1 outer membrane beta-barrel protein [Myroides sp. WP-1]